MTKRFTRDLQSLLQYIYIYNYLIINILYIYYIMFVTCKSCKRKKLIKSFFTKTDSNGFKTSFTIYNLQNLTSSFYKFGVLKYLNIFVKNFKTYNYKKSRQQTDNRQQTTMNITATSEQKKTVRHYERNLIKLLSMSEADHTKALVEDGYDKQLIKARLQTIRGHMVNELRNIQRWRKGKSLN